MIIWIILAVLFFVSCLVGGGYSSEGNPYTSLYMVRGFTCSVLTVGKS